MSKLSLPKIGAIFSFVFCALFLSSLMPHAVLAYAFPGGAGTSGNPYQIESCTDLQNMSTALSSYYILENSIDCTGTTSWNSGAGFIPVGTTATAFSGSLNGNGKVINGLYIDNSSLSYVGLFGYLNGASASVTNLGLTSVNITGGTYVGALAGTAGTATVTGVYVSGGSVTAATRYAGGMFGWRTGGVTMNDYASLTSVTSDGSDAGGFAAFYGGSGTTGMEDVYSTGSVTAVDYVGGFVAETSTTSNVITNAFTTASVTATTGSPVARGRFIGRNYASFTNAAFYDIGTPTACAGTIASGSTSGCTGETTVAYFQSASDAPLSSWDFSGTWAVNSTVNNAYPYLQWQDLITNYTLAYTAGSHGSLTGTTSQTVASGANGSAVTAVPATGYSFTNWSDSSTANPRTDTDVLGNISVTANFSINSYTLSYAAGSNGSLTGTTTQTVTYGGSGSAVTAVPASGYVFVNWSDSSTANPRTDTSVASNLSVTANFATTSFSLTYAAGSNGTISGTTSQSVTTGASGTAVTAVPNTGYHFVSWSDSSTQNPRTDTDVLGNVSVTATFAINTYTLSYAAGSNGSLTGTTSQTVNYGTSGSAVTAVPNSGYYFVSWSDASTQNPRTDASVSGNVAVTASFAMSSFSLAYAAGSNGTISGVASQTVASGDTGAAVTAVPNTGYHFVSWSDSSTANPRTDTDVLAPLSVTATFAINSYTLSYAAGPNGSLTGTTTQTVTYGGSGSTVTAVPDTGYFFSGWSDASSANPRTDTNVAGNFALTAMFSAVEAQPPVRRAPVVVPVMPQAAAAVASSGAPSTNGSASAALDFSVDAGVLVVPSPSILVSLNADPSTVQGYAISLDKTFADTGIHPYAAEVPFTLPDKPGTYTIYLKYYSTTGNASSVISHTVSYGVPAATSVSSSATPDIGVSGSRPAVASSSYSFTKQLSVGSYDTQVAKLQSFLNTHGFPVALAGSGSKGQETMFFGAATKLALAKFQSASGIKPASGCFGPLTMRFVNQTEG